MQKLESKEAIEVLLEEYKNLNKSRLARMLNISPQALNNYLKYGNSMSLVVADKVKVLFDIEITDVKYVNRALTVEELKSK